MRRIIAVLLVLIIGLASCQKEPDFIDPNTVPAPISISPLLSRSVQVDGNDSLVTTYAYDSSGRLIKKELTELSTLLESYQLVRNASGIITKMIVKGSEAEALYVDSINIAVFYNAALAQYTYTYSTVTTPSGKFSDSTVFVYDAAKNVISKTTFITSDLGDSLRYRYDYSYASGNLIAAKEYEYDRTSGIFSLVATETYTYDDKVNPLKLGSEAMLYNYGYGFGNHNMTRLDNVNALDPTDNFTVLDSYTYNADGFPVSGNSSFNRGIPSVRQLRFYYR